MQFQKKSSEYAIANLVQLGHAQNNKMTRNLTINTAYRPVMDANPIKEPEVSTSEVSAPKVSIPAPSAANPSRWSFSNIMSRVAEYMVADLALGACVMHPEAMLLLSETVANRNTTVPRTSGVVASTSSQPTWSRTTISGPARHPVHKAAPYRISSDQVSLSQEAQPIILDHFAEEILQHRADELFVDVEDGEVRPGRWTARFVAVAGSLYAKWQHAREIRQGAAELHAMDDRLLKDIGISRSDIEQIALRGRQKN